MAKGLRSKAKRKNRAEFRSTIGQVAAAKNMETTQKKLQECVEKGSMNSFERLSKLLGGDPDDVMEDSVQIQLHPKPLVGKKRPDKVPAGRIDAMKKSRIRGQKKGQKVTLRTSTKKK